MGEVIIPEWLDEQFLSTSLQGGEESEERVEVKKFFADVAAPAGSNYGSYVLRVKVDFTRGTDEEVRSTSVIIKSPVTYKNESANKMMEDLKYIEAQFYYQFIPEVRKLCDVNFLPKDFYCSVPAVVVLEDLKEKGFVMKDRLKQLDLDHCRLYAVAAASFHAASVAVHKKNPQVIELIGKEKLYSNDVKASEIFKNVLPHGIECMANYMDKTEFKKYSNLIRKASPDIWKMVIEAHKPNRGLNTLNQGDPWVTNMMFRYDDLGNVCEIKLLDFQALRFSSPITDLVFFLWCGANHDVRDNGYQEYFHLYCDTLNSKLQELGCPERLSYTELLEGVKALSPLSVLVVTACLPMVMSEVPFDFDDVFNDEVGGNGEWVNKMAQYFTDEYCATHLSRQLRQLELLGVFDFLGHQAVSVQ